MLTYIHTYINQFTVYTYCKMVNIYALTNLQCVCVCVCVCLYIYTHTHTSTHTDRRKFP